MKRTILLATLTLAACSNGTPPSATVVNGTAETVSFSAPNALYNIIDGGPVVVLMSDDPAACDRITGGGIVENDGGATEGALILIAKNDEHFWNNDVRTVGDDLDTALAAPRLPDGGCVQDADAGGCVVFQASSGKAHMIKVDNDLVNGVAAGDFDLTFPDGNEMSGTFHASPCTKLSGCPAGTSAFVIPFLGLGLRRQRSKRRSYF
ncbi:MAG: hypothetical protein JST54_06425 [Deltaproteobacteria bacterium]|nr:hypothetical protein [Deltaproteobacteria bacterium]